MNLLLIYLKKKINKNCLILVILIIIGLQTLLLDARKSINNINDTVFLVIQNNDIKKLKKLIQSNSILDYKDSYGYTPLHWACFYNSIEIAKIFFQKNFNIHTKNNDGWTLLHTAVSNNSVELVKLLLLRGVDIESKDDLGWTPLQLAICCNSVEVVQLLINAGVNVNIQNKYNLTPMSMAVSFNSFEMVELLINAGAVVNSFILLKSCESEKIRDLLITHDTFKNHEKKFFQMYFDTFIVKSKKSIKKFVVDHAKEESI